MNCNFCHWRCNLSLNQYGICKMYQFKDGVISERFPNKWSTYMASRVESLPFYHAYPGSRAMTIGTVGCNFDCKYCANSFLAKEDEATIEELQKSMFEFTPKELVNMALKRDCHNIVFNVNEPLVSLLSLKEVSKEAKAADLPMGCLTNAFMTEESTEIMAGIFSFMNISLKGLSDDFCRKYLGINSVEPVLRSIKKLALTTHLEITTPIIQSVNDKDIDAIAQFIAEINPQIPWHVFRLLPEYKMKEAQYPNIEEINQALEKSRQLLKYVYFHNFVGSDWVNTYCPQCKTAVIERFSLGCGGDKLSKYHCVGNACPNCGQTINIHGERKHCNPKEVPA